MPPPDYPPDPNLRRSAEERLRRGKDAAPPPPHAEEQDPKRLMHELQVHQVELQQQYEDLCETRDRMETALNRYTELYDFAPMGHFTLSVNGTISDLNLAGAELLGSARARLAGQRFQQFIPDDQREDFLKFLTNTFAGTEKQRLTATLWSGAESGAVYPRDTTRGVKRVQIEAIPSAEGSSCRVSAIDITDKEQAEATLRMNAKLLEAAAAIAKVGGWELDLVTGELFWTPETYHIHETSPEAFHPSVESGLARYLPDSRRLLESALEAARTHGEGYDLELEMFTNQGRPIHVRTKGRVTWVIGRPAKLTGAIQDITEAKLAEERLRHSEELARATLNALTANICVLDEQGVIIAVNDAWIQFGAENGSQSGTGIGTNYLTVCDQGAGQHAEMAHDVGAAIRAVLQHGEQTYYAEYPCHSPDERRWFALNISRTQGPGPKRVVVAHENITSRKEAVLALEKSRQEFRELVGRVQQAREEESSRIAREVHDELGQQLTGLKMDLRLMERGLERMPEKEMESTRERVVAMNGLVDEIVKTVQGIAAGLRPPLLDQIGLVAALRRELNLLQSRSALSCEYRGLAEEIPLSRDLTTACFRIAQEALTNVVRHAEASEVVLELSTDGANLKMEIQDNGSGHDWSQPSNRQALGILGMKERANLEGGEVTLENRPEGGTVVRAVLPLVKPPAATSET